MVQLTDPRPAPMSSGQGLLDEVLAQLPVAGQDVAEPEQRLSTAGHVFLERPAHQITVMPLEPFRGAFCVMPDSVDRVAADVSQGGAPG